MLISIEHVGHTFDAGTVRAHSVLHDVNLTLTEPRIGIIGHNGSGKSTLIRMLDGLILPTQGSVSVDGFDTAKDAAAIRRTTGFIFTDPDHQIIMPTVSEDVAFGLRRSKLPKDEVAARVDAQLVAFGLKQFSDQPAHLLSGGQKQLLALASVLITDPGLLLMDEPTTLLDTRNARMFGALVADLDQNVILATHHLHLLADFDRVIVFDEGKVVADGTPSETIPFYDALMEN
ncbi:MAG: energy-coupling factor ABC transporter ATP-binding protein [Propionibacteriaceae bacterium]|jgi:biotin transport system ATP-binding protein|nr:energy-coupling factor ABC transporter ATP-binding protein [Propionibacteriaceae bacterium]